MDSATPYLVLGKYTDWFGTTARIFGVEWPLALLGWLGFVISFHVFAGCCTLIEQPLLDKYAWPQFLRRFRMHFKGRKGYLEMMPLVLFNQTFVLLPCVLLVGHKGWGFCSQYALLSLSTLWRVPIALFGMSLGHDVVFYIGHRYILHTHWGLPIFRHDVHHSTKAADAVSALFMHPFDFFVEIVLPYLVPYVLIAPLSTSLLDVFIPVLGVVGGTYEHSGFNFWPDITVLDTRFHAAHHIKWSVSYSDGVGSTNLMDALMDTAATIESNALLGH
ncbi:hypothetical protein FVE85_1502 [Porphyridium purpureum]|uniref:Fatty acid hydroxylase domain-containing protein n=1 Tax=Porphyridium purpureum TaxID=35688 RepID=A0A5J4YY04_PORPP|nr:hypothetical protein FVE85_1502 [Porphyridium purpureum]|eukprot:POR8656..scf209_3